MKTAELEAIRAAIRHARNMIEYMADAGDGDAMEDEEIREIYYKLNGFAIKLTEKITPPWEKGEG